MQATIALVLGSPSVQAPPPLLGEGGRGPRRQATVGTLTLLDGTPLAGAQVEIQRRCSVQQRGEAVKRAARWRWRATNESGRMGGAGVRGRGSRGTRWLRAFYAGADAPESYGASVSETVLARRSRERRRGA